MMANTLLPPGPLYTELIKKLLIPKFLTPKIGGIMKSSHNVPIAMDHLTHTSWSVGEPNSTPSTFSYRIPMPEVMKLLGDPKWQTDYDIAGAMFVFFHPDLGSKCILNLSRELVDQCSASRIAFIVTNFYLENV